MKTIMSRDTISLSTISTVSCDEILLEWDRQFSSRSGPVPNEGLKNHPEVLGPIGEKK